MRNRESDSQAPWHVRLEILLDVMDFRILSLPRGPLLFHSGLPTASHGPVLGSTCRVGCGDVYYTLGPHTRSKLISGHITLRDWTAVYKFSVVHRVRRVLGVVWN